MRKSGAILTLAIGMLFSQVARARATIVVDLSIVNNGIAISGEGPYRVNENRNVTVQVSNANASHITINSNQYSLTLVVTRSGQAVQRIVAGGRPNLPPNASAPIVFNNVNLGANAGEMTLNAEIAPVNTPNHVDDRGNNRLDEPVRISVIGPRPRIDIRPKAITAMPSPPVAGIGKILQVQVVNDGDPGTTIASYAVTLRSGGQVLGTQEGRNLRQSSRLGQLKIFQVTLEEGNNTFEATTTVLGEQGEPSNAQGNNTLVQSIQAAAAPVLVDARVTGVTILGGVPYMIGTSREFSVMVRNGSDAVALERDMYSVTLIVTRPGGGVQRIEALPVNRPELGCNQSGEIHFAGISLGNAVGEFQANAVIALTDARYQDNISANNQLPRPTLISVTPRDADLRIASVDVAGGPPYIAGSRRTVNVIVVNDGPGVANEVRVTLDGSPPKRRIGGAGITRRNIPIGGDGARIAFDNVALRADTGQMLFQAFVAHVPTMQGGTSVSQNDPERNNNAGEGKIDVAAAGRGPVAPTQTDISVTTAAFVGSTVAGQPSTVRAVVHNPGPAIQSVWIYVMYGPSADDIHNVLHRGDAFVIANLPAGASTWRIPTLPLPVAGSYSVVVFYDAWNDDPNHDNDKFVFTQRVAAP